MALAATATAAAAAMIVLCVLLKQSVPIIDLLFSRGFKWRFGRRCRVTYCSDCGSGGGGGPVLNSPTETPLTDLSLSSHPPFLHFPFNF